MGNSLPKRQERLWKAIDDLRTAEDLTEKRTRIILDSLDESGGMLLRNQPWLFKEMVNKANFLVESKSYVDIIEHMADRFKELPTKSNEGLLDIMLDHINQPLAMRFFERYQDNFLRIIQVLVSVDNGRISRRQCFWLLFMHKNLKWTNKLVEVFKELLQDSPNLSWVPPSLPKDFETKDWLPSNYEAQTVLYSVFQCMPIILSKHESTANELIPLLLTEIYLQQKEEKGNVLHALVNADWKMLGPTSTSPDWVPYKEFIDMTVKAMPNLCNMTDADEMTPIQCFFRQILRFQKVTLSKEIIELLRSNSNINNPGNNGNTILHMASEAFYKHPNLRSELTGIILSLISKENVNAQNNSKETPYSWIFIGRLQFEDKLSAEYFSKIEQKFLEKNADTTLAKAGSAAPMYEWVKELIKEKLTDDRIHLFLYHLESVENWEYIQMRLDVLEKMLFVSNPSLLSPIKAFIGNIVKNGEAGKKIFNFTFAIRYILTPLTAVEVLSICAEAGTKFTPDQEKSYYKWIPSLSKCGELPTISLRILFSHKPHNLDMNFLAKPYTCSPSMIQCARKLVRSQYVDFQKCIDSKKLINCLIFNAKEGETIRELEESYFEKSENWLKRSSLHLAAIFLESFACLSQNMIEKYIHTKDLHGCTPMHIAYLCQNEQVVTFLTSMGAKKDAVDLFGATPQSLGDRAKQPQPAMLYDTLCRGVMNAKKNTFLDKIKPMMFMEVGEAITLHDELIGLFELLVKQTKFKEAKVVMTGSMREKTKVGWLDEGDVQLQFKVNTMVSGQVTIAGETYSADQLVQGLSDELIGSLEKIIWEGINLRPICVTGPWEFIREGHSLIAGTVVSVDVVAVIVTSNSNEDVYELQKNILKGAPKHWDTYFVSLQSWKRNAKFKPSRFAFEWDITDNLPNGYRLAILIAKSVVQAYHQTRPEKLEVKIPITSYTIKTALFFFLAYDQSQPVSLSTREALNDTVKKVYDRLEKNISKWRTSKLEYDPKKEVRWLTAQDFDQHQEESIALVSMTFNLIKYLAEEQLELNSIWDRNLPVQSFSSGICKDLYVLEVCEFVLRILPEI